MSNWVAPGYTEIRELGRGGSGRVVLATHDQSGIPVAVKYLAGHLVGDHRFIQDFRAEARILSEVESPYVARLYEYLETASGAAIVMELVDGVTIRAMLRQHGPTEPALALLVLKGSLLGLAATHARGVVHRDYKPENVLVDGHGQSKLADFGIAVRSGRQGVLAGTPSYMAPEQWAGATASPQTDIYAATATFYECLTGRPPYVAPGDLDQLRRHHQQAPIPVEAAPEALRGLIRRGMAKDPAQRPKDAATFLRELESVAGGAYGPEWEDEAKRKLARRALLLALIFPLAISHLGGTAVAATGWSWIKKALVSTGLTVTLIGGLVAGWFAFGQPDTTAAVATSVSSSPSESPSPSPSAVALPVVSLSPTRSAVPSPSTSPKPAAKAISLNLVITGDPGPCPPPGCPPVASTATLQLTGYGQATLHLTFTGIDGNNNPVLKTLTEQQSYTVAGQATHTFSASQSLAEACFPPGHTSDIIFVRAEARVEVGGKTVFTAQPAQFRCRDYIG